MSKKLVTLAKKINETDVSDEPNLEEDTEEDTYDEIEESVEVVPIDYDINEAVKKAAIRERDSEITPVVGFLILAVLSLGLSAFFLFSIQNLLSSIKDIAMFIFVSISVLMIFTYGAIIALERSFSNKVNAYTDVLKAKHKQCKNLKKNSLSPDDEADDDVKNEIEVYKKESLKRNTNAYAIALLYVLWVAMCIVLARINITTNILMFTTKQFIWIVGTATCVAVYVVSKCLNNRIAEYRVNSPRLSLSAYNECRALLTDDINDQLPYKVNDEFYAFKDDYFDRSLPKVDSLGYDRTTKNPHINQQQSEYDECCDDGRCDKKSELFCRIACLCCIGCMCGTFGGKR